MYQSLFDVLQLELRNLDGSSGLTKIIGAPRGSEGRDGSATSAVAYGEFKSIVCTGDMIYVADGDVLREYDILRHSLETVCGQTDQYFSKFS